MKNNYDVIVVGGGVAGVSAALSARRENKKVLLIEKTSVLGGLATSGLINWFEPLCDGQGHQILFSQVEEFFNLALKYGYKTYSPRMSSFFDHNLFALSLNKLLTEEGVDISYETSVCDVILENQSIKEIEILTVEGKSKLSADQFIDATGNAFLFRKAGVPVREGSNYLTYATISYKNGPGKPVMQMSGSALDGSGHPQGMKTFNGLKQDDVNEYVRTAQEYALNEYESGKIQDISAIPSMPQFRKIASIEGEYCLTNKDSMVHHEDSIGVFGAFNKFGELYEIPVGCLYSKKINNLYACGRIISSDDNGWEVIRVIPVAILTGEVAGLLAASKLPIKELQNKLSSRGIKLHF